MRTGLDIIRELVEVGDDARTLTVASVEQWMQRLASLCTEAEGYIRRVDGKDRRIGAGEGERA